jgi:hypothetical protein
MAVVMRAIENGCAGLALVCDQEIDRCTRDEFVRLCTNKHGDGAQIASARKNDAVAF